MKKIYIKSKLPKKVLGVANKMRKYFIMNGVDFSICDESEVKEEGGFEIGFIMVSEDFDKNIISDDYLKGHLEE